MAFRWEAVDNVTARCKKNLRPLAMSTDFSSTDTQNPWLMALNWMGLINQKNGLSCYPSETLGTSGLQTKY
jgi:hypothetical protein